MKTTLFKAGICVAVSGLLCTVAFAQKVNEVQVRAHRGVTSNQVGRDRAGLPIMDMTMTLGVSLADLDLSTSGGKREANRRIFAASGEVCSQMVQEFPEEAPILQKCTRETSHQAQLDLNRRVAQASQPGANR